MGIGMIDVPPKLWLPPKPSIIREWKREDLRPRRIATFPFPIVVPFVGGGAFPTVVTTNVGNETVADTTYSAPLPASLVSGNLLIVIASAHTGFGATQYNTPAGWTLLFQSSGTGSLRSLAAFYKVSNGSEGASLALTLTGALGGFKSSTAYQINGQNGNPEAGTTATGTSSAPNPPNLAPSWGSANTLFIALCAQADGALTAQTAPTNYGSIIQDTTTASGVDNPRTASAVRNLAASSDDPGAFGASVATWAANTIAVRPL
jgi:hypothetical protein